MRRALLVSTLLCVSISAQAAGREGGWRPWRRGGRGTTDATATTGTTRRTAVPKRTRTVDAEVTARLAGLHTSLDARLGRMAKDSRLEFDVLENITGLADEAERLEAEVAGDPVAEAELHRYTTRVAQSLHPILEVGQMGVRESNPSTAVNNLTWTRRIAKDRYSDWGMGGLNMLDHELRVGLGNLQGARLNAPALASFLGERSAQIGFFGRHSGVELRIPTEAELLGRVDGAQRELTTTVQSLKSYIIGRL